MRFSKLTSFLVGGERSVVIGVSTVSLLLIILILVIVL